MALTSSHNQTDNKLFLKYYKLYEQSKNISNSSSWNQTLIGRIINDSFDDEMRIAWIM